MEKLREYNEVPEDMPTLDEMWAKLTGTYKEFTLVDFQQAMAKVRGQQ